MNASETKSYGPVNLSQQALSVLAYLERKFEDTTLQNVMDWINDQSWTTINETMKGYDGFPIRERDRNHPFDHTKNPLMVLADELQSLHAEWTGDYPLRVLLEANGTGLRTHMRADELPIGRKFWTGEDGGSKTKKVFRRIENPFGPNVVDGMIAAKVSSSYDGTRGNTVKVPADQIVRPINQPVDADDNWIGSPLDTPEELAEGQRRWDDYRTASDAINERVDEYVKSHGAESVHVHYSNYKMDERDVPVDNLDEIAVKGKVIFKASSDEFFGGDESSDYESPVLENPTWLELCRHFNDMMLTTGDFHHCFFEGVYSAKQEQNGVPVYRFGSGS